MIFNHKKLKRIQKLHEKLKWLENQNFNISAIQLPKKQKNLCGGLPEKYKKNIIFFDKYNWPQDHPWQIVLTDCSKKHLSGIVGEDDEVITWRNSMVNTTGLAAAMMKNFSQDE